MFPPVNFFTYFSVLCPRQKKRRARHKTLRVVGLFKSSILDYTDSRSCAHTPAAGSRNTMPAPWQRHHYGYRSAFPTKFSLSKTPAYCKMGAPIQTYHISIANHGQKHKRKNLNFLCFFSGNHLHSQKISRRRGSGDTPLPFLCKNTRRED